MLIEKAKQVMQEMGIGKCVRETQSLPSSTPGFQPDDKPWTIGIVKPDGSGGVFSYPQHYHHGSCHFRHRAKAHTDGKRYSHTIGSAGQVSR